MSERSEKSEKTEKTEVHRAAGSLRSFGAWSVVSAMVAAAAGCGPDGIEGVDPAGTWNAVHIKLVSATTSTQSLSLPYTATTGDQTTVSITFFDDGSVALDDSGDLTTGTWANLGPRKFEISADLDWDALVCTIWADDDDAMQCVFTDPDASLTVDLVR